MASYISRDGSYHEGDGQIGDVVVPQRTDVYSAWGGNAWQPEAPAVTTARIDASALAAITSDKTVRTFFEAFYDLESRVRVLEAKPTITKAQYRTALLNVYKALP